MGRYGSSSIGCFVVVVMILLEVATGTLYTVGDSLGWRIPPNSTDYYNEVWAKNKTFLIGDQLEFKWNEIHNVASVPKEQYENCGKNGGSVWTTSPRTLNLTENGTRYFICTVGLHCTQGQKLEITVGNGIAPPSAAPPSLSTAPLTLLFILSIVLAISLLNFHA